MNNNNLTLAIILLIAAIIVGVVLLLKERQSPDLIQERASLAYPSITDEKGEVIVTVTPLEINKSRNEWSFKVTMETHTVELDHDLTKTSVIIDDAGRSLFPIRWEGATGGHHREGVLIFTKPARLPSSFRLVISDIGGFTRSFNWK